MDTQRALVVMQTAALRAGAMLLSMQPDTRRLGSRKDFLTDADLRSEEEILRVLSREYPNIGAFSEESGGHASTKGYLWVIDPVDGTVNYFLGDDHWGVSIALVHNGESVVGVIYLPAKQQLFVASENTPARVCYVGRKGKPWVNLKVNKEDNPRNAQFWIEWGKEERAGRDHDRVLNALKRLERASIYPHIRNAATSGMMVLAQGKSMGHVFLKPEPFDIAAAALIVERAGGLVTDIEGKPWNPFSTSTVSSNRVIHNQLLGILNGRRKRGA